MVGAFAPAKINLTLHVTGRRADGYHLLDSLVAFADVGDRVFVASAPCTALTVSGPMAAGVPVDDTNLALRAARLIGAEAKVWLTKSLPSAAGLGGGSSDAAAVLRALSRLTGRALPEDRGLSLGADVPACLLARPCRVRGIGENVVPLPSLPRCCIVLANPGVAVPTASVFRKLQRTDNPPMPTELPDWPDAHAFAEWLAAQRNDLEAPARAVAPEVAETLAALAATEGCLLARMSGSGATCFGLFAREAEAGRAAEAVSAAHPEWWCVAATLYEREEAPAQKIR